MGLSNFFKKIFLNAKKIKKNEKPKILKEVSFENLEDWIRDKEIEIREDEQKIIKNISIIISEQLKHLDEKIKILNSVDVKSIKAEEKIKLVVNENLKKYLEDVLKLKNDLLKEIRIEENNESFKGKEKKNLKEYFMGLDQIFKDFEKRTYTNYQKATILVGKEIAEVNEIFKKISKQLKDLFELKKELIDSQEKIIDVQTELSNIKKIDVFNSDMEKKIKDADKKIEEIKKENLKISQEIEEIKKSPKYLDSLEKKKEVEKLENNLEREIYSLKNKIDFKELGNVFHSDEKRMMILKDAKENFLDHFEKDRCDALLKLINEIENKSMYQEISEIIDNLKEKREKIKEIEKLIDEDALGKRVFKQDKNLVEINNLEIEKEKQLKNTEKSKGKRKEKVEEIIKNSKDLGAIVQVNEP
ncbi:hypothetical protein K0A97_03200 [Patescibacteria group bacterium]|nr:hypothetical protein [Patescibacteria group bacterium]